MVKLLKNPNAEVDQWGKYFRCGANVQPYIFEEDLELYKDFYVQIFERITDLDFLSDVMENFKIFVEDGTYKDFYTEEKSAAFLPILYLSKNPNPEIFTINNGYYTKAYSFEKNVNIFYNKINSSWIETFMPEDSFYNVNWSHILPMMGSGTCDFACPSDGSKHFNYVFLKLDNGDAVLCFVWEWYNK